MALVTPASAARSSASRFGGAPKSDTLMVSMGRPASPAIALRRAMPSAGSKSPRPRGNHPSAQSTTRRRVWSVSPPTRIGGFGRWTGFGYDQIGSKSTNSPWNSGSSSAQMTFIARARSLITRKRVAKAVPWFSISSAFQPAPIASSNRPPERRSREAASFALTIGSRSVRRQIPVPRRMVLVAAAATARATKGSRVCQYSRGSSGPPGHGLRRLAGMWVCSGTNSDSKPRCSASRASSSIRIV